MVFSPRTGTPPGALTNLFSREKTARPCYIEAMSRWLWSSKPGALNLLGLTCLVCNSVHSSVVKQGTPGFDPQPHKFFGGLQGVMEGR